MIPTYNARANYQEETLRSVLQQDPGPERTQIEVVDNCSPHGAPTSVICVSRNAVTSAAEALYRTVTVTAAHCRISSLAPTRS
jgi:cellulose synthase/poly-beta-1,6-N-acetylglucosamine synthase-like glycosyltransferase